MRIHGIILAGAHRWPESALDRVCAGPLLPIVGRPLIWYVVEGLHRSRTDGITICGNSCSNSISACLERANPTAWGLRYYEDPMPRGPAGCARDAALASDAQVFIIVEGTLVPRAGLDALLKAHLASGAALTVAVHPHDTAHAAGGLEPAGAYVASREALEQVPAHGYQDIKESWIPALHRAKRKVLPWVIPGTDCVRVSGFGGYLAATAWSIETAAVSDYRHRGYTRTGDAWIHRTAQVARSARLSGSCLVGANVRIADGVSIVGPCVLGPGTRVGPASVLSRVIAWPRCDIGKGAILSECLLLEASRIQPNTIVREAIWRADHPCDPDASDTYWMLEDARVARSSAARVLDEAEADEVSASPLFAAPSIVDGAPLPPGCLAEGGARTSSRSAPAR